MCENDRHEEKRGTLSKDWVFAYGGVWEREYMARALR